MRPFLCPMVSAILLVAAGTASHRDLPHVDRGDEAPTVTWLTTHVKESDEVSLSLPIAAVNVDRRISKGYLDELRIIEIEVDGQQVISVSSEALLHPIGGFVNVPAGCG